ncbi:MAG: tetratricopeptide repeat protein [Candidatus Acidiferrales bacterium]
MSSALVILMLLSFATPTTATINRISIRENAAANPSVDRLELLGMLAAGTDMKYVLRQITQRQIDFTTDQDFWSAAGKSPSTEWLKARIASLMPVHRQADSRREAAAKRLEQGMILVHAGQFRKAEREYRAALALEPRSATLHCALGTLLQIERSSDAAIVEYREAIALKPSFPAAHAMLGATLQATGQPLAAVDEYKQALRLDSGDVNGKIGLGMTLVTVGKYAEALPILREVMSQARVLPILRKYYATALLRTGDIPDGTAQISAYLQGFPDDVGAHVLLAGANAKEGKRRDALEQCAEALRLSQNDPDVRQSCQIIIGQAPR